MGHRDTEKILVGLPEAPCLVAEQAEIPMAVAQGSPGLWAAGGGKSGQSPQRR